MNIQLSKNLIIDPNIENLLLFSPCSEYISTISQQKKILIYQTSTCEIFNTIFCHLPIDEIRWTFDSKFLIVLMKSKKEILIFDINEKSLPNRLTKPFNSLNNGIIEIESFKINPKFNQVLISGFFSTYLIFWDLNLQKLKNFDPPKSFNTGLSFSNDGNYLAYIYNEKGKDFIKIFSTKNYSLLNNIELSTIDSRNLIWSSDDSHIIIIDSNDHHLLQIIDLLTYKIKDYSAYEGFLGISGISECINSKLIAFGSYDNIVRVLVFPEWKLLSELLHETSFQKTPPYIFIDNNGFITQIDPPYEFSSSKILNNGIKCIEWSFNGKYISTQTFNNPNLIYIWNIETISLECVIIFSNNISSFHWCLNSENLIITLSQSYFYIWNSNIINKYEVESQKVNFVKWDHKGDFLIIYDSELGLFSIGHVVN